MMDERDEQEFTATLEQYLAGQATRADLAQIVDSFDWDERSPLAEKWQVAIGRLELLLTEIAEDLRGEDELRTAAANLLRDLAPETRAIVQQGAVAVSGSDSAMKMVQVAYHQLQPA